ncbi:hypothetical protein Tco_1150430 [Tanacetum coccineum]
MDTRASYMMNFRMMNQECVKLDKFDGCTYTRWAEKMKFLLIVLKIYYVLDPELPPIPANPVPEPSKPMDEKKISELEKQRMIRKEDETLCCGHIKSSLSDTLCNLYASVTNPRELWSALEFKYKTHEQEIATSSGDYDSEDEVASVDNDKAKFLAKEDGYGTQSLFEQWTESYENGDYGYDPYDDDMYEGQDIPEKLQAICVNLDITVRGRRKK